VAVIDLWSWHPIRPMPKPIFWSDAGRVAQPVSAGPALDLGAPAE
jgi:hypothetical protein